VFPPNRMAGFDKDKPAGESPAVKMKSIGSDKKVPLPRCL
jgi:hypothetical protein